MPRDDLPVKCVVHSKVFIVDDSFYLFTTANIHDLSFSRRGNMELAMQCTVPAVVASLYAQTWAHYVAHRHLFRSYHVGDPDALSMFWAIHRIFDELLFLTNKRVVSNECDVNDVSDARVMDVVFNRLVNPVYHALYDTSLQQTTGVRLPLR